MNGLSLAEKIREALPLNAQGRYDLLPLFGRVELFDSVVKQLSEPFKGKADVVIAPEAVGWILGTAVARELKVGFVPVRKHGKLSYPKQAVVSRPFIDASRQARALELAVDAIPPGSRVLIVDERVQTGAQAQSCIELAEQLRCIPVGIAAIGVEDNAQTRAWVTSGFIAYIGKGL